jgi:hypothetical protein
VAEIVYEEPWRCFFSESEITLHIRAGEDQNQRRTPHWSLIIADRTVMSGTARIAADGTSEIKLTLPPVKPGVVLDATLRLSSAAALEAQLDKSLAIFPADAFSSLPGLQELEITLFDPTKTTADVLTKTGLPITQVRTAEALRTSKSRFIVIGEGVPADRHADLPQVLMDILTAHRTILCLAPASGHWRLPMWSGAEQALGSITLRRGDAIRELNKRFDFATWPGAEHTIEGGLVLETVRGQFGARMAEGSATWPWVETNGAAGGRVIYCGFGLIKHWEATPVPRYILAELLQRAVANKTEIVDK